MRHDIENGGFAAKGGFVAQGGFVAKGGSLSRAVMQDFVTALALVLVIEGTLYALFPEAMKRAAARALFIRPQILRIAGLAAAGIGVMLVWLVRG